LFPFFLEGLLWLFEDLKINVGDAGGPIAFAVLILLDAIGHAGYVVCLPFLLSACILLITPGIPWRVKLATAAVDLAVGALLFWEVGSSRVEFRRGLFG